METELYNEVYCLNFNPNPIWSELTWIFYSIQYERIQMRSNYRIKLNSNDFFSQTN